MSSPTTASRSRSWRRLPRDLLVEALAFLDFRDYCVGAVRTSRDLATTFDRVRLRVATLVDPGSSPARDTLMRMIERCPRVEVIRPAREKYRDREFMHTAGMRLKPTGAIDTVALWPRVLALLPRPSRLTSLSLLVTAQDVLDELPSLCPALESLMAFVTMPYIECFSLSACRGRMPRLREVMLAFEGSMFTPRIAEQVANLDATTLDSLHLRFLSSQRTLAEDMATVRTLSESMSRSVTRLQLPIHLTREMWEVVADRHPQLRSCTHSRVWKETAPHDLFPNLTETFGYDESFAYLGRGSRSFPKVTSLQYNQVKWRANHGFFGRLFRFFPSITALELDSLSRIPPQLYDLSSLSSLIMTFSGSLLTSTPEYQFHRLENLERLTYMMKKFSSRLLHSDHRKNFSSRQLFESLAMCPKLKYLDIGPASIDDTRLACELLNLKFYSASVCNTTDRAAEHLAPHRDVLERAPSSERNCNWGYYVGVSPSASHILRRSKAAAHSIRRCYVDDGR